MRQPCSTSALQQLQASMGPRSENRGYGDGMAAGHELRRSFNGSTVREPWLWSGVNRLAVREPHGFNGSTVREPWLWQTLRPRLGPLHRLQWVHGPRTVVMCIATCGELLTTELQWVHGPRTVVMWRTLASRQPRTSSFNGSTVREPWLCGAARQLPANMTKLQWVHGPRTVVMCAWHAAQSAVEPSLQWVHGPRTVVMARRRPVLAANVPCFNGSTVREPWLWRWSGSR